MAVEHKLIDGFLFTINTTPNSSRPNIIYKNWIKNLKNTPHEAIFITRYGDNLPMPHYIFHSLDDDKNLSFDYPNMKLTRELLVKRYLSAKYFIQNTSYKWLWSLSDDVHIKIENIIPFIQELNSKYNTIRDHVLLGHCVTSRKNKFEYLQGGTGYVLSRKTAQALIDRGIDYINNVIVAEDYAFVDFRKSLGLTANQTASPYIYGHVYGDFRKATPFNFINGSYHPKIPHCPSLTNIPKTKCYGQQLFPYKKLTGFHCSNLTLLYQYVNYWEQKSHEYPNLSYYFVQQFMKFCTK